MKDNIHIWHFGDTHHNHRKLEVPEDIDIAIFSGDAGTYRDPYMNEPIVWDFIDWYSELNIPYKIFVAGNHDSAIEKGLITEDDFLHAGIAYLEDELNAVSIKGEIITIYGSPWTPTFNNWSYNKARHKLHKVWDQIPPNVDILVTHGPPQGILDLANSYKGYEFCGCANLYKQVTQRIKPKYHMFGHIHDHMSENFHNAGVLKLPDCNTIFSNGSVCTDGRMNEVSSNGNVFNYKRD